MTICLIERPPGVFGYQARVGAAGPGRTQYFAFAKHGDEAAARAAAEVAERELRRRFPPVNRRGKAMDTSRYGIAGIRFEWCTFGGDLAYLYVRGNWTDATGRYRAFGYSVERNGLEGALRKAVRRRREGGAPVPPMTRLLAALREAYARGPVDVAARGRA